MPRDLPLSPSPRPSKRLTAALAVLPAAAVALFAGAAPALAAPSAPVRAQAAPPTPVWHPEADHMGSTIRAHERLADPPALAPRSRMSVTATGQPLGMDVSSFQGNVDWQTAAAGGAQFAYIKATESTGYINPYLYSQFTGAYAAGIIRGSYHFALPDQSSGADQAAYFTSHGGLWSGDGKTLPPMLDMEYNPYGPTCYGMSASQLTSWIADFNNAVHATTGRYPVIYTTTDWWTACTGNTPGFAATSPLFIARYASSPGVMPAGWGYQTIWQYSDVGIFPGDADVFNGSLAQLRSFAVGGQSTSVSSVANPITVRYQQLGGSSSYLGAPVDAIHVVPGGQAQTFQYGMLLSSAATGVHEVHGAIYATYRAYGGPSGPLGLPLTDETTTPDRVGRFNHFSGSGGSIYWSPSAGAHEVQGMIRARWASVGWERSRLGYPVSNEYAIKGGRRSDFVGGAITWIAGSAGIWYW